MAIDKALLIVVLSIVAMDILAKDFGRNGHVFEIKEEGFLAFVKRRLENIDIEKHQKIMIETTKKHIAEPKPVLGVVKTIEHRNFIFDPTYIVLEDIKLPNGEILHKAGTKVNPLEHMDFDRKLFFIDSRDSEQVIWLKESLKQSQKENRIILIAGRPLDLSDDLNINIYFDQFGELTKKFGIRQVPAIIEQRNSEKFLRIEEIICEKNR